jgi:hypothetical protein
MADFLAPQQSGVDWYSPGGQYAHSAYAYEAPSTSAGNYGSFEDEAPLLEGAPIAGNK